MVIQPESHEYDSPYTPWPIHLLDSSPISSLQAKKFIEVPWSKVQEAHQQLQSQKVITYRDIRDHHKQN